MTLKISLLFLLLDLLFGSPSCGKVVHYGPGWNWSQIAANHRLEIPDGVTPVAVADCRLLGRTGYLSIQGRLPIRVMVADCTAPEDQEMVRARGIVVEVPYLLAKRHGFLGDGWARASLWLLPAPMLRQSHAPTTR